MMPTTEPPTILVRLDASTEARAAIDVAVRLATAIDGRLSGLFVQDVDLLRLAELPFASLVGHGGELRRLGPAEMERMLDAEAERARRWFERGAAEARLVASFRVVRGRPLRELAAEVAELVVMGGTARVISPARRGRLVAVAPETPDESLLQLAEQLTSEPASALLMAPRAALAALRELVRSRPTRVLSWHLGVLPGGEPSRIARALARERPGLVLVQGSLDEQTLRELRSMITCPLVLSR